jgi:MFS family permease
MTIYLTRVYAMSVENIGYALTVALTIGVVFSLGFGILADKFDKKRYMLVSITAFILGFVAIPLVDNVTLVVLFFALINCAYSVFSTVLKAWFSDVLNPGEKAKVFSLNYSFLNIGWTVGPPIGTLLVMYSLQLPFWLAALCAAFPLVFIQTWVQRVDAADSESGTVAWQPSVLLKDRALFWYTLSGLLASYVGGSFASCISQYVLAADYDSDFAQQVVAVVLPVNAAMVVSLQYLIGRKLNNKNIRPLMTLATLFFVLGLAGFMVSDNNLIYWGVAAAIFTVGEIIYAPGEYMLIDSIAPPGMKSSYFSAQALGWLGAAFNPRFTGIILTHLPHWSLFAIMMVAIVIAWLMILRGMRVSAWRDGAPEAA